MSPSTEPLAMQAVETRAFQWRKGEEELCDYGIGVLSMSRGRLLGHRSVITALRRLREEDGEFGTSLSYRRSRLCL